MKYSSKSQLASPKLVPDVRFNLKSICVILTLFLGTWDVEEKLICAKKQNTARDAPSGRSRAAEVHNLSERVSRIIVENFLSFWHAKKVFVEIHPFWTVVG